MQFDVILIRPEPRLGSIVLARAHDVLGNTFGLINGVGDTLQTDAPALMGKRRAISRRPDVGCGRRPTRIRFDPVVDLDPCGLGQRGGRRNPDTNNHEINIKFGSVSQHSARNGPLACQAVETYALAQINAMTLMQGAEIIARVRCRDPLQNAVRHLDQCDLDAAFGCDSCGLKPDIATPHDQGAFALHKMRCHRICIRQIAHGKDILQVPANCSRQAARIGAGGQHKVIVRQHLSPCRDGLRRCINRLYLGRGAQRDPVFGIETFGPQEQTLKRHLAQQISLGQRRSLVGGRRFRPDQRDRPLKSTVAQFGNTGRPCLPRAYHDHMAHFQIPRLKLWSLLARDPISPTGPNAIPRKAYHMTISQGDALPDASFIEIGADGPSAVSLAEKTAGRKVVLFAVPGAFTPTCHSAHVPSFIRTKDQFAAKGVDEIICVSVNDPFVMKAWGESTGATEAGISMLADADASFTKAVGMEFSAPPAGLTDRSKRYAMLVEDGKVTLLQAEESPGTCEISGGEALLENM